MGHHARQATSMPLHTLSTLYEPQRWVSMRPRDAALSMQGDKLQAHV